MAVTKGNRFPVWVQPVYLCFVSIPLSIPLRVAYPPPWSCPIEFLEPFKSGHDARVDVCPDASVNCRTAAFPP